jgi:hypothetical protein
MASREFDLLGAFEGHSVEEIRAVLDAGFDVRARIKGKSVVNSLLEMYSRSDDVPDCLRLLLERGAVLDDPRILPVLLNDADGLSAALEADPSLIGHRTSMISTFTPLIGASLLHVAAEYGNLDAARVLVKRGADLEARASVDKHGLNGHTPIFHTVNSNDNRSAPVLELLLKAGARPDVRLEGITWGKGFEWETTLFDVTPISYAQLGLLPQVHRGERDTYANIVRLLKAAGRPVPPLTNVPNRYLAPGG